MISAPMPHRIFIRQVVASVVALLFAFANKGTAQSRRMRASDVDTIPVLDPGKRISFGSDSLNFGELRLPVGTGPFAIAIVLHGGCWYSPYATLRNTAPLAEAITVAGVATWNIEYRRYDQHGGGWPGTFRDVAAAADFVRELAKRYPIDTSRVVLVGHSAGAHLALWLASRATLGPTSELAVGTPMTLTGVVSIGGIADLREFYSRERASCGNPAVESLLGGVPDSVPQRVRDASPIERLPLRVNTVHVAGERDAIAPRAVIERYADAARAKGDTVEVVIVPDAGHFEAIVPYLPAGRAVVDAVKRLALPRAKAVRPRR
ncbi:MAG: alpha/beta hydrolase [Gemmatimonas sp.]